MAPQGSPGQDGEGDAGTQASKLAAEGAEDVLLSKLSQLLSDSEGGASDGGSGGESDASAESFCGASFFAIDPLEDEDAFYSAYVAAIDRHDSRTVRSFLELAQQADPPWVQDLVESFDSDESTMLLRCIAGPRLEPVAGPSGAAGVRIASLLLEARADANHRNRAGETPLLAAAGAPGPAALETVRVLLAAAADPSCADVLTGRTPLMRAAGRGERELCQELLAARADPLGRDLQGLTARDMAVENQHVHVSGLLRGAAPRPAGAGEELAERAGPLWEAVRSCSLRAVKQSLEDLGGQRLALAAAPVDGATLLHVCAANASRDAAGEIARELLALRASAAARDASGRAPLDLAVAAALARGDACNAAMDTVRVLLVAGDGAALAREWRDPAGPLASAADTPAGERIGRLLRSFGAELPWLETEGVAGAPGPDPAGVPSGEPAAAPEQAPVPPDCGGAPGLDGAA